MRWQGRAARSEVTTAHPPSTRVPRPQVLQRWQEAGGDAADPSTLRKLFLKQAGVPALATTIQARRRAAVLVS